MNEEEIKFYEKVVKYVGEEKLQINEAQEYLLECLNKCNKENEENELFKGIFEGLCDDDITQIIGNNRLSEFHAVTDLSEHISEIEDSEFYTEIEDRWKMLIFYKLGILQGKKARNKR